MGSIRKQFEQKFFTFYCTGRVKIILWHHFVSLQKFYRRINLLKPFVAIISFMKFDQIAHLSFYWPSPLTIDVILGTLSLSTINFLSFNPLIYKPVWRHITWQIFHQKWKGARGSVVECLTRDQGAVGSSLTGVTALWSLSNTHLS